MIPTHTTSDSSSTSSLCPCHDHLELLLSQTSECLSTCSGPVSSGSRYLVLSECSMDWYGDTCSVLIQSIYHFFLLSFLSPCARSGLPCGMKPGFSQWWFIRMELEPCGRLTAAAAAAVHHCSSGRPHTHTHTYPSAESP